MAIKGTEGIKVKVFENGHFAIHCPACKCTHAFDNKRWTWNGDVRKPDVNPSMHVTIGPYPEHSSRPGHKDICHFFLRSGDLQFLADCNHALAGQTVPCPDYPGIMLHSYGVKELEERENARGNADGNSD